MKFIKINENDNVAVAIEKLAKGTVINCGENTVEVVDDISAGHKVALKDIECGTPVVKYGYTIGNALQDIKAGQWIHTHNIKTALDGILDYTYAPTEIRSLKAPKARTFQGYRRKDGKVGIRNEVWIIPTVGCVNGIVKSLEKEAQKFITENIDAVVAFPHPYGCSQLDADQENTRHILADLVNHQNAGGVLVVGLGCENSSIEILKNYIGDYDENRVRFLKCQDHEDEISDGLQMLRELVEYASSSQREEIDAGELVIGLKCGGSDGFSGITANPLCGRFSDMLVSLGGTAILTEVPEMFGAETILMNRAKDKATFEEIVDLINDFKLYYEKEGLPIYENPSPGNKAGGISTLEDKSLGCTQKSGDSLVCGVMKYGESVSQKGLNLLCAPGNDLVASTALAASGAHIVLFTTGRGTPFACPVPTIKISSNSALYEKKNNWIDFNAGPIVENSGIEETADKLFDFILDVASGKKLKSELSGYRDMTIFKKGVTL